MRLGIYQKFWQYVKEDYDKYNRAGAVSANSKYKNFKEMFFVAGGFIWEETPERYDFWWDINEKWKKEINNG